MLKITAFMKPDVFWSLFAMPIGLVICFGPALFAWVSFKEQPEETEAKKPAKH